MKLFESKEAKKEAGRALFHLLSSYKNTPVLLMLSGGSALSLLEYVGTDTLDQQVTLTTLDERFSADPSISNFAQIKTTSFFNHCLKRNVQLIDVVTQKGDDLESASSHFEAALKGWRASHPAGIIIATMGIGIDGHTAGIFKEVYDEKKHDPSWVVGYVVPKDISVYQERITVTKTFLKTQVDHAIVFAAGQVKRELLKELQTNTISKQMPMNILTLMKDVLIYIES